MPDRSTAIVLLRAAFERETAMRPVSGQLNALPQRVDLARVSGTARRGIGSRGMHQHTPKVRASRPQWSTVETISAAVDRWLEVRIAPRCSARTVETYRHSLALLVRATDDAPVHEITRDTIGTALADLSDGWRPTAFTAWSSCLRWLGYPEVVAGIERPKSRRRTYALTSDALPHWVAALNLMLTERWASGPTMGCILLGSTTCLREGEIATLRWTDCDLGTGLAEVDGKTGRRRVQLGTIGASIVSSQPRVNEYVFASRCKKAPHVPANTISRACRRVLDRYTERTGYRWHEDMCFHALRHTFTSHARAGGISAENMRQLGGWATTTMMDSYSHLVDDLREQIDRVQGRLVAGLQLQMAIATT